MGIRLIATDLDGTLLDDEKRVPEENRRALEECAGRGIEIVPATGRTVKGIPEELKVLPGVRYVITTNGAVIADLKTGEIIDRRLLPNDLALTVLRLAAESRDDVMYDAYIDGDGITKQEFYDSAEKYVRTPGMVALIHKTRRTVPDIISHVEASGMEVDKINLFFTDMDAKARMRERLKAVPGLLVTSSIPNNLEINAAGADKGGAIRRLADHLRMDYSETMAFGDGENDLSMMMLAGLGVAMGNGEPAIREAADYVTSTNEECGVAAAIRKFVLK